MRPALRGVQAFGRWARQSVLFWGLNAAFLPAVALVLATSGGETRRSRSTAMIRWWGWTTLRIFGVRLDVDASTAAELARRRPRIVTFNHSSTLDICLMTALWPTAGTAVVKRELLRVPLIGQTVAMLDFVPLDRRNPELAQASLRRAAQRVSAEQLSVLIAPEGTRAPDGKLLPFKLGAFHLAAQSGAPIVPLVLHGVGAVWPRSQWYARPGTVTARLLAEHTVRDVSTVHESAETLHAAYQAALDAGPRALSHAPTQ